MGESPISDVQRSLDARGQRGSWMPGAGQIPTFPLVLKKICIFRNIFRLLETKKYDSSPNISDDFLKSLTKIFDFLPKLFRFVSEKFPTIRKPGRWMPPISKNF